MASPPRTAIKQLARTILKDPDPLSRKEALLEIRKYDDKRLLPLLEQVSAQDADASVRDLAKNVLVKKKIEAGIPTDQVIEPARTAAVDPPAQKNAPRQRKARHDSAAAWTCAYCGADNHGGVQCATCGAPHNADAYTAPDPSQRDDIEPGAPVNTVYRAPSSPSTVYVINHQNKAFLAGKRARPVVVGMVPGLALWFFVPFLIAGIVIFGTGIYEMNRYNELERDGIPATAEYVNRDTSTDDEGDITYYVSYRFVPRESGRSDWVTVRQSVGQDIYNQAVPGTIFNIRYALNNPGNARIEGTNDQDYIWAFVFAFCWNGIIGTIFFSLLYARMRQGALVRQGRVIEGEIYRCSGETDSDDDFILTIKYTFRNPDTGEWVNGEASDTRNDLRNKRLPPRGMPVAVLYRNPKHYAIL